MRRTFTASSRTVQISRHLHHQTMATPAPKPAPWRAAFVSHVEKLKSPTFTLSNLHPISSSSSSDSAIKFGPRARTVVYRGMWAALPVNPKNTAELNPEGVYESDLLTITTDCRMEKIRELFKSQGSEKDAPLRARLFNPEHRLNWASLARLEIGRAHV